MRLRDRIGWSLLLVMLCLDAWGQDPALCADTSTNDQGRVVSGDRLAVLLGLTCADPVVASFACDDGADNDGDGEIDLADDGCSGPTDDDESDPPPPAAQCDDGADNDGDGEIDLADDGCSGPTDDDESDPVVVGALAFEEVFVELPSNDAGAYGLAAGEFSAGQVDVVANTHAGAVRRWRYTDGELVYISLRVQDRCILRMYAYDVDLDGQPEAYCEDSNVGSEYFNYATGMLTSFVCGNTRRDDCVPRVWMPDGALELITRDGRLFLRDGLGGAQVMPGSSGSSSGELDKFPVLLADGVLSELDLSGFFNSGCSFTFGRSLAHVDFDGDGDRDLFFMSHGGLQSTCAAHYLEQLPGGQFIERMGRTPDIGGFANYHSLMGNVETADIDGDGDLDLVSAGNSYGDVYRLLINDGSGTFTRFAGPFDGIVRGWPDNGFRPQAKFVDLDQDGCMDVVVTQGDVGVSPVRAFRSLACD